MRLASFDSMKKPQRLIDNNLCGRGCTISVRAVKYSYVLPEPVATPLLPPKVEKLSDQYCGMNFPEKDCVDKQPFYLGNKFLSPSCNQAARNVRKAIVQQKDARASIAKQLGLHILALKKVEDSMNTSLYQN